jgi:hypothetical protein
MSRPSKPGASNGRFMEELVGGRISGSLNSIANELQLGPIRAFSNTALKRNYLGAYVHYLSVVRGGEAKSEASGDGDAPHAKFLILPSCRVLISPKTSLLVWV